MLYVLNERTHTFDVGIVGDGRVTHPPIPNNVIDNLHERSRNPFRTESESAAGTYNHASFSDKPLGFKEVRQVSLLIRIDKRQVEGRIGRNCFNRLYCWPDLDLDFIGEARVLYVLRGNLSKNIAYARYNSFNGLEVMEASN